MANRRTLLRERPDPVAECLCAHARMLLPPAQPRRLRQDEGAPPPCGAPSILTCVLALRP